MKKLLLATCLLAANLLPSSTFGQDKKVDDIFKTYRFAMFVSPTFNSLRPTSSTIDNYAITKGSGNVGFSFGLEVDYNINDRYTILSGIGMDWRGGTINTVHVPSSPLLTDYASSASVDYRLQYLTLPIALKMVAVEVDKKTKVFAQTGFDLGILLSQRGNYTITTSGSTTPVTGEKTKLSGFATSVPLNIGWGIGPGVEYDLNGKNSVFASILYRNGFIDHTSPKNNKKDFKFSDGNIRSNSFAIRIGYFF